MRFVNSIKQTVSLIAVLVLLLSTVTSAWAASAPSDDLKGHWAEAQMRQWIDQGLLKGDNGHYYPNREITRAEFVTLINRALKLSESAEINFKDLNASHWAYEQVAVAVKAGYITGYDDKTIRINQTVTREEAAVMTANLLKLTATDFSGLKKFKDAASLSTWSKSAVQSLVDASILQGNSKGSFVPQGKMTRAEAVTMLQKALDYTNSKENLTQSPTQPPKDPVSETKPANPDNGASAPATPAPPAPPAAPPAPPAAPPATPPAAPPAAPPVTPPATPSPEQPNVCTGTSEECSSTKLINLTASDFTLRQLDNMGYETGTGFNPNVRSYSLVTAPDTSQLVKISLAVTKSRYQNVTYSVIGDNQKIIKRGSIDSDSNSIELDVMPRQDFGVLIYVSSGDDSKHYNYELSINYSRSIQDAFKIVTASNIYSSTLINPSYLLAKGSLRGEKLRDTDSVLLFDGEGTTPFYTCNTNPCLIPREKITNGTGVWKIEVYRGKDILASGDYHYDLRVAAVITADTGLTVAPYTKQELFDPRDIDLNQSQFGYHLDIDTVKLHAAVPEAKYVVFGDKEMTGTFTSYPQGLRADEFKFGIDSMMHSSANFSYAYSIDDSTTNQRLYSVRYSQNQNTKFVNDRFVFFGLYDENRNLIGQYMTVLQFDQDHVADGYTAARNWQPAEPEPSPEPDMEGNHIHQ